MAAAAAVEKSVAKAGSMAGSIAIAVAPAVAAAVAMAGAVAIMNWFGHNLNLSHFFSCTKFGINIHAFLVDSVVFLCCISNLGALARTVAEAMSGAIALATTIARAPAAAKAGSIAPVVAMAPAKAGAVAVAVMNRFGHDSNLLHFLRIFSRVNIHISFMVLIVFSCRDLSY